MKPVHQAFTIFRDVLRGRLLKLSAQPIVYVAS